MEKGKPTDGETYELSVTSAVSAFTQTLKYGKTWNVGVVKEGKQRRMKIMAATTRRN